MEAGDLTLYHYRGCSYCGLVQSALEDLGLEVAGKDILREPEARRELIAARGRATVPVLRIREGDTERWMPESADIVRYLYDRFGEGRSPPRRRWGGAWWGG